MINFVFKCPVCSATVELSLKDDEVSKIKDYIKEHGKSPTYSTYCKNGHHIAVLVSVKEVNGVLKVYPREVFELTDDNSTKNKKNKDSIDWIIKHFG